MKRSLIALLLLTLVLTGCSLRPPQPNGAGLEPRAPSVKVLAALYFGDADALHVHVEERWVVYGDETLAEALVKALLAGPSQPGLYATLPREARLLSLDIVDGIAHVNFSREFLTKHPGGTAGEMLTIASVVNTLTELPEIDAVQLLLDNVVEESIWGHATTSEPFERWPLAIAEEERVFPLYFAQGNSLVAEQREVVRQGSVWAEVLANAAMQASPTEAGLAALWAPGSKVNSVRVYSPDVAYVDLPSDTINLQPQNWQETLAIYALVESLTSLPEIGKVQFLVDGRIVDTLRGGVNISTPLTGGRTN